MKSVRYRNLRQVSTLTMSRRHKGKKAAYVKPIKASDERTLENAILMANQLASKSMHDLDKRCVDDMFNASPQESPVTPNSSTKKFTFKFPTGGGGGSSGKHHHSRSSSPPSSKGSSSRHHHHNHHFSDEVNAHTDLESMITPTARDAYRSLIEGGGGGEKAESCSKAEPNSAIHYRSETLTASKTFSTASSHRLSLPPSASTFGKLLADHPDSGGPVDQMAGGAITSNPLPLPPKDRKSSVTAGKRHVRKNPLIIPSGAAANMARRAEDHAGKF